MTLTTQYKKLLSHLIAFDTTSRNSNLGLINFVADRLDKTGARIEFDYNADKTKANLFASIGPDAPGGIVLSGHTDTVPVDGQNWTSDPYQLIERDGRYYGRGAVDMKGFDALAIAQFIETSADSHKLVKPLYLALTYDEEVGCIGAGHLLNHLDSRIGAPDLVLVGEPTGLSPVYAHKGIRCFKTDVHGHAVHSSNPDLGANAINGASQLINKLYRAGQHLKEKGLRDKRFDPPHSTLNVGTITGGNAINIVAADCSFTFEIRPIPGEDSDKVLKGFTQNERNVTRRFNESIGHGSVSTHEYVSVPAFLGDVDHPASRLLIDLAGKAPRTVPFTTEAGVYQSHGWNTIVCGPGNIAQAHQPNEYIEIQQLEEYSRLLNRLTRHCFTPA